MSQNKRHEPKPFNHLSTAVNGETIPHAMFNLKGRIGPRYLAAAYPHREGVIVADIGVIPTSAPLGAIKE